MKRLSSFGSVPQQTQDASGKRVKHTSGTQYIRLVHIIWDVVIGLRMRNRVRTRNVEIGNPLNEILATPLHTVGELQSLTLSVSSYHLHIIHY